MTWEILDTIWTLLNTPAVIAAAALLVIWLLNRVYAAKPLWKRFEGTIITAIEWAEHQIPNTVEDKGLKRLDKALQFVLDVCKKAGLDVSDREVIADIKEGVQIKYADVKAAGNLST